MIIDPTNITDGDYLGNIYMSIVLLNAERHFEMWEFCWWCPSFHAQFSELPNSALHFRTLISANPFHPLLYWKYLVREYAIWNTLNVSFSLLWSSQWGGQQGQSAFAVTEILWSISTRSESVFERRPLMKPQCNPLLPLKEVTSQGENDGYRRANVINLDVTYCLLLVFM